MRTPPPPPPPPPNPVRKNITHTKLSPDSDAKAEDQAEALQATEVK